MVLIGLLGRKSSGKDTFADHCCLRYGFNKKSFATPLKNITQILFGFNNLQLYGEKKEEIDERWGITPRKALQFVGTDLVRKQMDKLIPNIGQDFWLKHFEINYRRECNGVCDGNSNVHTIVSDIRYQNEADLIHKLGGVVIKISRRVANNSEDEHISEAGIDDILNYDIFIENNESLEKYYSDIDGMIKELLL